MGLLDLFVAASMPVLKVLLVTGLGLILALDRIDLLGDDARKHLNNIVFFVFSPALVSSNLAKTITYESMKKLWFMPFNILITFIIGSILGWAVLQITRPSQHLRGLVVGCCAAGNLGNMLLIIIPAVCKEKGSPFGDPGICHTYGMGYASLSMAVGAIYLWSYVYNIVRISSSKSTKEVEINDPPASRSSREGSISQLGTSTESLLPSKVPPEQLGLPSTRFDHKTQAHLGTKLKQYMENLSKKINLKTLLAPSTTGAIAGFIVGLVPQIRKLMIGDVAPLRVIENSAILLGDGAIPLLTLIMGVKGAIRLGLVQHDPLYQFVLLLQFALPPAMNIGTITQLFGAGESECSVIMLWAYALASISLTLWTTFFMWLVA
ncbi:protein PIN-LIKES 1 isoform X4 [Capsicum annuum]|uniref:protein PIN-LIKES 1 isoform X4 n=1 Tax=Capsicum annuum TaxID=4072 RepID=UPI001FB16785|nr:protein PIN-LIKES 1 isoform X4 [Capsicum annuum]XP_047267367.1 protein PIN-LIKES 1 isoform X4 [Capsicum annuum]XP_047267368.1 protein PIN-LIKES 1 isoform X4 [Capsicum annuum]